MFPQDYFTDYFNHDYFVSLFTAVPIIVPVSGIDMAKIDTSLQWNDRVEIVVFRETNIDPELAQYQYRNIDFDVFRSRLFFDPSGIQEVRIDRIIDLSSIAALSASFIIIPAGSIITYIGLIIVEKVSSGGNTAGLGLGQSGSAPSNYGNTVSLLPGATFSDLLVSSKLGTDTEIDICAVTVLGALANGILVSGKVRVVLVYNQPAKLTN